MPRTATILLSAAVIAALAMGCGSTSSTSSSANRPATSGAASTSSTAGSPVGALSAEAKSAATGDIPDTQVFLTYTNPLPRYSISYPEGWTRKGSRTDVTFSDKNNIVHIVITKAGAPTAAAATSELNALKRSNPTLTFTAPSSIRVKAGPAIKATYNTTSSPSPVTGKTVLLVVDRYELSRAGERATIDLGTAKGVDNVDAYRMMINSFRWH
jgi:hypothetical protein